MSKDMCVPCGEGLVNIRVGALIPKDGKILMVESSRGYLYSVGGRIKMGETAREAVVREVFEETGVLMPVKRLIAVHENYFYGDMKTNLGKLIYEVSFYFLMDVSKTSLMARGGRFTLREGPHTHDFEWLDFRRLKDEYFYPLFLKTEIFDLPEHLTLRTDIE